VCCLATALLAVGVRGQERTTYDADELEEAQREVPQLVSTLELEPGMTVADVGAGFGAWTVVLSRWLGPTGKVYSTDVAEPQLASIRAAVAHEDLRNVVVLRGAEVSANLPAGCCDAILMRDVYHHIRRPAGFNFSSW